jgi:hypothetical protein
MSAVTSASTLANMLLPLVVSIGVELDAIQRDSVLVYNDG